VAEQTPNPKDAVTVTPKTAPVKHGGILYAIGKPFEALWHEVEDLVHEGIAEIEGVTKDVLDGTKAEMQSWLQAHQVEFPGNANKTTLQELIQETRKKEADGAGSAPESEGTGDGASGGDAAQ